MKQTLIVAVLAVAAIPLLASETPEKAVSSFYESMAVTNFSAAVGLVHPTELAKARDILVPFLQKAEGTNGFAPILRAFTKDNTAEEIGKLTPNEVFMRLMAWGAAFQPGWVIDMKRAATTPIGCVKEGDTMHVVCRQTTPAGDTNAVRMAVVSAMKDKDDWKVIPPYLQPMAQQLTKMGGPRPSPRIPTIPGKTVPSTFGPIVPRERPVPKAPGAGVPPSLPVVPAQPAAPAPTAPSAPAAPAAPATK